MICEASFHRWSDTQRGVDAAVIEVHEVERNHVSVILNFLAETVRESRKAAHPHSHGKIAAFHEWCAHVVWIGLAA